ncbi:MAG: hypothetical protein RLY66_339 [Candidatus Parcubacteria bacterium]|jgi:hypothetical protein
MNNINPSSDGKTKNITIGYIIGWFLGIIFALTGLVNIFSSPISGLVFLLASAILIPPIMSKISSQLKVNLSRNVKILLVLVLLAVAGFNLKSDEVVATPVSSQPVVAQPVPEQVAPVVPPQPQTLEEKIKGAIENSLKATTNTDKPRVISIEISKYKPVELTESGYKSTDSVSGLFIKVNSDENLTTNLLKGSMHDDAAKVFRAVFPLSEDFGDIILWSYLPVKDKYGNQKDDVAIVYSIARPLFSKINWSSFYSRDLPSLLTSEHEIDSRNNYHEAISF